MHQTAIVFLLFAALAQTPVAKPLPLPPPVSAPPPLEPGFASGSLPTPLGKPGSPASVKRWQADLQSPQRLVRLRTVKAISQVHFHDVPAALALLSALKDKDPEVRSHALKGLKYRSVENLQDSRDRPLPQIISTLLAYITEGQTAPEVQVFALRTLVRMGIGDAAAPQALKLMNSSWPSVRLAAMNAYSGMTLVTLSNPEGKDHSAYETAVQHLMQDPDAEVRGHAAEIYCYLSPQKAITSDALSMVLERLQSPIANIRSAAALTLTNLADKNPAARGNTPVGNQIVAALLPLIRDPNGEVRHLATLALSTQRSTTPAVIRAMAERVNSDSTAARFFIENEGDFSAAAPELLQLVRRPLRDSLDTDGQDARNYAFNALGKIATTGRYNEAVRAALITLLSQPAEDRYGAFEALAAASTEHPELVSTLLQHLQKAVKKPEPRAEKLVALMVAQKDRKETFSVLTRYFDREQTQVRQQAMFNLCHLTYWALGHRFLEGSPYPIPAETKTSLALDWMVTKLFRDKDTNVRKYAAHGIGEAFAPDGRTIPLLLPGLDASEAEIRTAVAQELVNVVRATAAFAEPFLPTDEHLASCLQRAEMVITRFHELPEADRARLGNYAELQQTLSRAKAKLLAEKERREVATTQPSD